MSWFGFSDSKFKRGEKVFITYLDMEGTIIDIENNSYMVEVYGDNTRRFVEVCSEDKLRKI